MRSRAQLIIALSATLLLAVVLRVWGVGYGLPYPYHVDEPTYVSAALNLGAGTIGKQPNPTGYSNILFGEFAAYYLAGRVTGLFPSTAAFEQAYRSDPSVFLLLGRLTSILLGAATVLVVYGLGKRSANQSIGGLLAALFLAVSFLHVRDSHYGVPDVPATFFISLSVLLCLLAAQTRAKKYFALAAATTAYAIATKWNVWPVMIPLIIAAIMGLRAPSPRANRRAWWSIMIVVAMFFFIGFALGGFELMLKPGVYLEYALREAQAGEAGGFGYWQIDTLPGWLFYGKTLLYGIGPVLLILTALGLTHRIRMVVKERDTTSLLLIAFPVLYFLFMGATQHYFARYTLPLVPFAAVLAADIIAATVMRWRPGRERLATGLTIGVVAIAIALPFVNSLQHDALLVQTDTRTLAKEWIEANIPAGAKLAADWQTHTPPLSTLDRPAPGNSETVYDVQYMGGTGLFEHTLDWYRQQGYGYLITSSFIDNIPLVVAQQNVERNAFYASLPQKLTLIKQFSATGDGSEPPFVFDEIYGPFISLWQRERPGPTIRIYQVR
jgi:hypothetical protein